MALNGTGVVQFVMLNRAQFDAMDTHESRVLYFISDTKELYRGDHNYSSAIVFHNDGARPERGAIGKLYINNANKEGTTWDGTKWSVVIPAISSTVLDGNNQPVSNPVSGVAVKNYVDTVAANTLSQCVTAMRWDATNKQVMYTVNNVERAVPLTRLATALTYDSSTGVVSLKDLNNDTISSINIPLDNFVTDGHYDNTDATLVLEFKNGTEVRIPAADLVQLYHDLDSTTVDITIANDATTGENTIKADVKISAQADNALEVKSDGLYIPPTTSKMDKVGTGHQDEVIVADANGNAAASGYKCGGTTLNADASARQTLLATEAAVADVQNTIEQNAELLYVKLTDVITSADDIDVDNPDPTKVLSEKALVEAMSWIELADEDGEPTTPATTYVRASGKYVAGTTYYTDATGTQTVDTTSFSEPTDVSSYFVAQTTNVAASGTYVAGTTYFTDASGETTVDTSTFEEGVTDVSAYFVAQTTYVAATGNYVSGTTYYTDNTGSTTVDTSSFSEGTDVSNYYVAQ